MSKRKKEIAKSEQDTAKKGGQSKALFMVMLMVLAVVIPSALAAYYLMGDSPIGVDYGDNNGSGGSSENKYLPGTHMVLAEIYTTPSCPACAKAEDDFQSMSGYRQDFYFVSMTMQTYNLKTHNDALYRYNQLEEKYVPSSQRGGVPYIVFDGGMADELGAVGKQTFGQDISYCKNKSVPDIQIDGSASMPRADNISLQIKITTHSSFHGYLRAFVIEKQSRYKNKEGVPIPNAFMGYAANESLSIDSSNPYVKSTVWEGKSIDSSNTAVIIAVYDSSGYAVSVRYIAV